MALASDSELGPQIQVITCIYGSHNWQYFIFKYESSTMLQSVFWSTQKSLGYLQHLPCKSFYNILRLLLHNGDFSTVLLQSRLHVYTSGTFQLNSLSCQYRRKEMRQPFLSTHMNFAVLSGIKDIKHRVITCIT